MSTLQPRPIRSYSDVLYQVCSMASVLYVHFRPGWHAALWRTCGITVPIGEEPTLAQLYVAEEFLLSELNDAHQRTEMLLEQITSREEKPA